MSGFIYDGISTNSVLPDTKLILASWDEVTEQDGSTRDALSGSTSILRPVPNEYGTTYAKATFSYSLIKENNEPFTGDEQRLIEKWLTSPKFSTPLTLVDCDDQMIRMYDGRFMKTSWVYTQGGWASCNFTFEANTPYAYYPRELSFASSGVHQFTCHSDETQEYTYPIVIVTADTENTVRITSLTDNNNYMQITTLPGVSIKLDCKHCILSDSTTDGVIDFDDIGWGDVGNIYWLRLIPGINQIRISGNATVQIKYNYVTKKLGGWL